MPSTAEQIIELNRELLNKTNRLTEIVDGAKKDGRDLSRRERGEVEQIRRDAAALRERIPKFNPRQASAYMADHIEREPVVADSRALRPEHRYVDYMREHHPEQFRSSLWDELMDPSRFSIGRMLRGMVTGVWTNAEMEHRAQLEGTSSSGGALLPTPMSGTLIDRIRNAARVFQAGATTVVMTEQVLFMGRLDSGPTPGLAWHSEGQQISASDRQVSKIQFTAQTLPSLTQISYELLNDMTDEAAQLLENEIVQALALEIDRVCLRGTGVAPQPCGILNTAGVTLTSLGSTGAPPIWDTLVDGVSTLRKANVEPSAVLMSARSAQFMGKLKTAIGSYMEPPPTIADIPRLVTNQIPDNVGYGSTSSEIYVGDFRHLMLGVRENIGFEILGATGPSLGGRVRVLQERYIDEGLAGLICFFRGDVQLAHTAAFNVLTNVSAS